MIKRSRDGEEISGVPAIQLEINMGIKKTLEQTGSLCSAVQVEGDLK